MLLFLTFGALVANMKKTTLHGGQSRSWSAEQGRKEKSDSPTPHHHHAARSEKMIQYKVFLPDSVGHHGGLEQRHLNPGDTVLVQHSTRRGLYRL